LKVEDAHFVLHSAAEQKENCASYLKTSLYCTYSQEHRFVRRHKFLGQNLRADYEVAPFPASTMGLVMDEMRRKGNRTTLRGRIRVSNS
jgi:hypothetical protein